ncbi:MAG: hypothetical protein DDT20_01877 [Firmicutes bacterium]|nr:hypothetical protein [Bacillota bacterium]
MGVRWVIGSVPDRPGREVHGISRAVGQVGDRFQGERVVAEGVGVVHYATATGDGDVAEVGSFDHVFTEGDGDGGIHGHPGGVTRRDGAFHFRREGG